ncbi:hypothetical protein E2R51_16730 [Jeotgalibacillus sp. S-D1]|uniref:hypothetical protein n=1 Tax=Jeotgalibacillus sp. S-D1 TaxID=2552189 RepID=UPI001059A064|nr:hypothetical protein [Jeotgalibacillus sp. S-D1]TDL30966.1 hypothetical protein E2R51_16730 [Jeotgalibacillus sp. S-D1]
MKSGILSLNKGLFQQQARSVSWIGIFFALALIIVLPLSILIRHLTISNSYYGGPNTFAFNAVFDFSFPFQLMAYASFPVLLAIILVNFTTKKAATDFMHSLPFTRQTILTNTYVVGAAALLMPIVLTGGLLSLLRFVITDKFYSFPEIAEWMGISFLIVLLIFIFTIMIGMFVGSGLLHAGLTYLMIVVPASLVVLVLVNLQYYVNGLALNQYTDKLLTNGIFLVRMAELNNRPFTGLEYMIYTLLAAVFVAVSYFAYTKRPSEATEQSIVFPLFRYVFLYGLTLFVMLIGGFYFSEIQQGDFLWTIIGYLLGAFIGYTILQMILQKTLRLSWPWKGFIVYGVIITLLIIPVNFVAGFYENAVPEPDEVESVALNEQFSEPKDRKTLNDETAINQVIDIHNELIHHKRSDIYNSVNIFIKYNLKDGSSISREYEVDTAYLEEISLDLRSNEAVKQTYDPISQLNSLTDLTFATIYDNSSARPARISDLGELDELIQALEKDSKNLPSQYLLLNAPREFLGDITFSRAKGEDIFISLTKDYEHTISWLKENGYSSSLMLTENIDSATIVKVAGNESKMGEIEPIVYEGRDPSLLPEPKIETVDSDEISELLNISQPNYYGEYIVVFSMDGNTNYQFYGFDLADAPAFITESLQ